MSTNKIGVKTAILYLIPMQKRPIVPIDTCSLEYLNFVINIINISNDFLDFFDRNLKGLRINLK